MRLRYPLLFLSAFLMGVAATLVFIENIQPAEEPVYSTSYVTYTLREKGSMEVGQQEESASEKESNLLNLLGVTNKERPSPHDWIKEHQIHVTKDRVVIDLKDAEWAEFTNTNSMDPVIDETSHAIEIVPQSPQDIHVGDIVSYSSRFSDGTIIHRVKEIGFDELGWYAVFRGDNNPRDDPERVRFSQIRRVLVAIIY